MPPDTLTLGFDTSAAHCAAALLSGDRVLAAREEPMTKGQAERLIPMLEEILAEAGVGWQDLHVIGVGVGPGNFTGVRISVAAARGLALALKLPAIGITTLEARAHGLPRPLAVVEDARRDQVYLQRLEGADEPPALVALADLPAGIGSLPLTGGAAGAAAALTDGAVLPPALPLAEAIARLAAARAATPQPRPAPLYLRAADAALPSEPPPVILQWTPAELAALHAACFTTPRPWTEAEFESFLAAPHVFLLGDARGFAMGRAVAGEAELLTLAVSPGVRRKGLGGGLLAAFEAEARARGAIHAYLEVAEDNAAARALYDASGYRIRGLRPGYFRRPDGALVDGVLMWRAL